MKKMIVSAFMLVALAATHTMRAQDVKTAPPASVSSAAQDNKTKIDPASLPGAVKTTLQGDAYKDWTPSNAWAVNTTPASYVVELKKDDKTTTLNISEDGKVK